MKKCLLQVYELQSFIMCSAKKNTFATICTERDADFKVDGTVPLYIKFCTYDNETVQRILSQANKWQIKVNITEDWDPSFGHTQGCVKKEAYHEIKATRILVRDGNFAGIVDYSKNLAERYGLFYTLISDYCGEPLNFGFWEAYGSSDHDMVCEKQFYLVKK